MEGDDGARDNGAADQLAPPRQHLGVHVPREIKRKDTWSVNNAREQWDFTFQRVFAEDCTQADVYDAVGRSVVASVLDGDLDGFMEAYLRWARSGAEG